MPSGGVGGLPTTGARRPSAWRSAVSRQDPRRSPGGRFFADAGAPGGCRGRTAARRGRGGLDGRVRGEFAAACAPIWAPSTSRSDTTASMPARDRAAAIEVVGVVGGGSDHDPIAQAGEPRLRASWPQSRTIGASSWLRARRRARRTPSRPPRPGEDGGRRRADRPAAGRLAAAPSRIGTRATATALTSACGRRSASRTLGPAAGRAASHPSRRRRSTTEAAGEPTSTSVLVHADASQSTASAAGSATPVPSRSRAARAAEDVAGGGRDE